MPRPRRPTATVTPLRAPEPPPAGLRNVAAALQRVRARAAQRAADGRSAVDQFLAAAPPPWVPNDIPSLAQDENINSSLGWAAGNAIASAFAEGVTFLGYSYLSQLAQRPEYRVITETIASEMTREWIEVRSTGEDDKTDKIKVLVAAMEDLGVREVFREAAESDGFFGRGHIYLDTGDTDDRDELRTSIGDGRSFASRLKVGRKEDDKRPLRALRSVEALWVYPTNYNSNDPLQADWYQPKTWYVMGKEVHRSRLLTLVGREVPDLLKPVYCFGGLSLSQMSKPYIDNFLRTRQSVSDAIHTYAMVWLRTNLQLLLGAEGDRFMERVDLFNSTRDNLNLMLLDKDMDEELGATQISLAGLDSLQGQSREQMAMPARIPLVKLFGIQPSGLNASSEGEIRTFYDHVHAFQELLFREPLTTVFCMVQLTKFGEVDPELTFDFKGLWQLDEAGRSAVQKTLTDIDDANVAMGAVSAEEVRARLAGDPESIYHGLELDPDAVPEPPGDPSQEPDPTKPDPTESGLDPTDPNSRLASSVTNRAAEVGGAGGEGFKE